MNRKLLISLMIVTIILTVLTCKRRPRSGTESTKRNVPEKTYNRDRSSVPRSTPTSTPSTRDRNLPNKSTSPNAVKMTQYGGVYTIPIEINDIGMSIIFDTGASNISISETEVFFLIKQGKITEEDFLGRTTFKDATGSISEGTRINLKKVKIDNKTIYNVEASVVHNLEAPLLLGQSALSKFGKLTIDYTRNEIIFE